MGSLEVVGDLVVRPDDRLRPVPAAPVRIIGQRGVRLLPSR
jgi:hypothetical protein